ncbi:hypothetical protein [Streptomyces sp. DW26H14]|uniref:hypothetical protein n=1 Tax=Streptomyces sp. DW26H14 TaxID=3435395 RepID=UPI00403DBE40
MATSAGPATPVHPARVRPARVRAWAVAALLGAAVLAGCTGHPASRTTDDPKPAAPTTAVAPGPAATITRPAPTRATASASPAPHARGARDGRNYPACADGSCQVLVDHPAAIPVGHRTLHVSVTGSTVQLTESAAGSRTSMSLSGPGGHGHLSTNGASIDVTVGQVHDGAAVLDITSP